MLRIGVISDTHGLLRPEAEQRLAGVDRIIHAGDIGRPEVIDRLRRIAPVIAIRGNVDKGRGRKIILRPKRSALAATPSTSFMTSTTCNSIRRRVGSTWLFPAIRIAR